MDTNDTYQETAISPTPKTILIVEDEVPLLTALKDAFEKAGFKVVTASNGQEGLKVALESEPNLIVLDILMPKIGGLEMLGNLRKENEFGRNVKVIILTNLEANDNILKDVVDMQPTYYLIKSDMTIEGILNKIKEVI